MIYLDPKDLAIDKLDDLVSNDHFYRRNYQFHSYEEMIKN